MPHSMPLLKLLVFKSSQASVKLLWYVGAFARTRVRCAPHVGGRYTRVGLSCVVFCVLTTKQDTDEYNNDPCCNTMLAWSKCCVPTEKTVSALVPTGATNQSM